MKVSELLSIIEKDGWFLVRQRGSHRNFITQLNQERLRLPEKPALMCRVAH